MDPKGVRMSEQTDQCIQVVSLVETIQQEDSLNTDDE